MPPNSRYSRWAAAWLAHAQTDPQTVDIAGEYDSTLTLKENKALFMSSHPLQTSEHSIADIRLAELKTEIHQREDHAAHIAALEARQNIQIKETLAGASSSPAPPFEAGNSLSVSGFAPESRPGEPRQLKTMRVLIENVLGGFSTSLVVLSPDFGIGKTHIVLSAMAGAGLTLGKEYAYFSGYTTPLSLFEFLYENREKRLIILDDIDTAYNNQIILTLLKNATFGVPERIVSYNSTVRGRAAPSQFEMKAGIILIANRIPQNSLTRAILSRALSIEISLTQQEKLDMLAAYCEKPFKSTTREQRMAALGFLMERKPTALKEMSYRLMQKLFALIAQTPEGWQPAAMEILEYDDDTLAYFEAQSAMDTATAIKQFSDMTGKSRASYFRLKRRLEWIEEGKSLKSHVMGE